MAEKKEMKNPAAEEAGEEYEILPHKELHELREELGKLKERPTERTLQISMVELASKLDRMMDIFEEAQEMIRVEEGALTFQEKMRPLMERMDKVLQQNSQIAEGIVGLHDLIMDMRDELSTGAKEKRESPREEISFIEPMEGPERVQQKAEEKSTLPPLPPLPPLPTGMPKPPQPPMFR